MQDMWACICHVYCHVFKQLDQVSTTILHGYNVHTPIFTDQKLYITIMRVPYQTYLHCLANYMPVCVYWATHYKEHWCSLLLVYSPQGSTLRDLCIFSWLEQYLSAHKDLCRHQSSRKTSQHHLKNDHSICKITA